MSGKTAILAVRIVSDAAEAAKGFDQTGKAASRWERGLSTARKAATAAGVAIGALAKTSFDAASEQQQAFGAVESVYGKAAGQVRELAKAASQSVGLSSAEYAQFAAVLGAQLGNLGVAQEDLIGTQDDLIGMAADLAATFGGTTADAVEALSALFRGETDPIEKYGVSIKAADVQARLAEQGLDDLTGAARTQAETQARLALLTEQTAAAQGQFGREADTAAGAQQRASAAWKDAQAALGQVLLPAVAAASTAFAGLAVWMQENTTAVQIALGAVAGLSALILTVSAVTKAWGSIMAVVKAATTAWTAVQWLLNAALTANPIALVIVAVAALIAGIIAAYKNSETFRKYVQKAGRIAGEVFRAIAGVVGRVVDVVSSAVTWVRDRLAPAFTVARAVAGPVFSAIATAVGTVSTAVSSAVTWVRDRLGPAFAGFKAIAQPIMDAARSAWDAISSGVRSVWRWVNNLISAIKGIKWPKPPSWLTGAAKGVGRLFGGLFSAPAPSTEAGALSAMTAGAAALTTSTMAAGTLTGTRAGGLGQTTYVKVEVNGALDPVAVGRQISQILRHNNVRLGMVTP